MNITYLMFYFFAVLASFDSLVGQFLMFISLAYRFALPGRKNTFLAHQFDRPAALRRACGFASLGSSNGPLGLADWLVLACRVIRFSLQIRRVGSSIRSVGLGISHICHFVILPIGLAMFDASVGQSNLYLHRVWLANLPWRLANLQSSLAGVAHL